MNIIHERADGTIVTSMTGVKAPVKASMILKSSETFAEVLRKEMRKIEKDTTDNPNTSVG